MRALRLDQRETITILDDEAKTTFRFWLQGKSDSKAGEHLITLRSATSPRAPATPP
jgi:hypothetical protein